MSKTNNESTKNDTESDNEDSDSAREQHTSAKSEKTSLRKRANIKRKTKHNTTTTTTTNATTTTTTTTTTQSLHPNATKSPSSTSAGSMHANANPLPTPPPPATQFSVQRSDTDGLRMKISAIRPTTTTSASQSSKRKPSSSLSSQSSGDRFNNNNTLKMKLSHKQHTTLDASINLSNLSSSVQAISTATANDGNTHSPSSSSSSSSNKPTQMNLKALSDGSAPNISSGLPLVSTAFSQAIPCLSDATESGCSEATTTTIAAAGGNEKAAKRVKLKRKKAQSKTHETKRSLKKSRQQQQQQHLLQQQQQHLHQQASKMANFSSDTDDDTHDGRLNVSAQRAPRLLLTAINPTKSSFHQIKSSNSPISITTALTTTNISGVGVGSDNIGLSSSDNELPDLVNAAIKRVESDTDDTTLGAGGGGGGVSGGNAVGGCGGGGATGSFRRTKTKHLQQYQSTLLQDFMEKTQRLGQGTPSTVTLGTDDNSLTQSHLLEDEIGIATRTATITNTPTCSSNRSGEPSQSQQTTNSQSESVTMSSVEQGTKKRRGRPKKGSLVTGDLLLDDLPKPLAASTNSTATSININESGDSGVISTTSTTQSTSPSPKMQLAAGISPSTSTRQSHHHHHRHGKQRKNAEHTVVTNPTSSSLKEPSGSIESTAAATAAGATANKPKIDIAYLDKRMYAATERVLYPPPRNKRRQSMSALVISSSKPCSSSQQQQHQQPADRKGTGMSSATAATATTSSNRITKEELQLDPVWRKIDVNKKFRRPSLSGYKSDGGGGNTTICSKILAAKSGYVSDYGSSFIARSSHRNHNSGYKSDASCKSRYSVKSCASRRSRAKSCGYRSDYKERLHGHAGSIKSTKFRRKRRCSTLLTKASSKSIGGNLNDEQDILQLAGLSLGQSSEESNEYVCKPNLDSLPSTSVSKKYGEINRFIATGEYFGRGSSGGGVSATSGGGQSTSFAGLTAKRLCELTSDDISQDGFGAVHAGSNFSTLGTTGIAGKLQLTRKNSIAADELTAQDLLPHTSRKIKSRRSSAASYCSSYYSGVSKIRRRRRRKSFRYPPAVVDSKLLTEIDILTSTFGTLCRIQSGSGGGGGNGGVAAGGQSSSNAAGSEKLTTGDKEKSHAAIGSSESSSNKLQLSSVTGASGAAVIGANGAHGSGSGNSKREARDKRSTKKRKMSENLDFAILSAAAGAAGVLTPSSGGSSKRRHKKTNSSSPDDHKLPLKKRHYLLTPGEKSAATEAAVAAKLFASNTEAWAAAAAVAKSTATTKSQQQFSASSSGSSHSHSHLSVLALSGASATAAAAAGGGAVNSGNSKGGKTGLTPKKRHLLHNSGAEDASSVSSGSAVKGSNSSPLRIVVDAAGISNSISGGKLLDISPLSLSAGSSTKHSAAAISTSTSASAVAAEVVHKKRSRLEGLVTKIATSHSDEKSKDTAPQLKNAHKVHAPVALAATNAASTATSTSAATATAAPQLDSETSCPPPGVFEPSVELEIQIPPITKLTEAAASIITKSEVDSPLLMDISKSFGSSTAATKTEGTRVVEALLNKTGANLILKRKRKKINRTGFPTVRRKKRKINEQLLLDVTPDISEQVQRVVTKTAANSISKEPVERKEKADKSDKLDKLEKSDRKPNSAQNDESKNATNPSEVCDRVPQAGEASDNFVQRNRTPRLSVVALERLQGAPATTRAATPVAVESQAVPAVKSSAPAVSVKPTVKDKTQLSRGKGKKSKSENAATEITHSTESTPKATPTKFTAKALKKPTSEPTNTVTKTSRMEKSRKTPLAVSNARGRKSKQTTTPTTPTATASPVPVPLKEPKMKITPTKGPKKSAALAITSPSSSTANARSESTAFTKSSVRKIITAKSLEAKVKLPAGIDPNTNFSCKIRLKRRSALFSQLTGPKTSSTQASNNNNNSSNNNNNNNNNHSNATATKNSNGHSLPAVLPKMLDIKQCPYVDPERPAAEIDAEAALKDPNIDYAEQDVLPLSECSFNYMDYFDSNTSDTGDEKSSSSGGGRKIAAPVKKNYLPAGLFSDYFKVDRITADAIQKPLPHTVNKKAAETKEDSDSVALPLLPPPHYCERYFRQTQRDFQLPYDIYWAYTHGKLPKRNTVPSWQYRKIRTNIYAESVRPNLAGFDHPVCNCKTDAGCGENCLNRMVYTECSPSSCPTRDRCMNQKIQRHEVAPGVERFMTTDKGWGVRTKLPIQKGTYILEYVGEVVTEREFKDRMGLIYQNDTHHYCLHLDGGLVIDGHRMGSDGRFVNHSCMPNCEMQKWSVNGLSRMALFAGRNIEPGEELTYDYNFSLFNPSEGQPCRCNTPQCRGVIGGKSQRVKPLPVETKANEPPANKDTGRNGRQRKRKAKKNTQRLQSKDIAVAQVQQLSDKEKKLVKQYGVFLVRCFEKLRRCRARKQPKPSDTKSPKPASPLPTFGSSPTVAGNGGGGGVGTGGNGGSSSATTPAYIAQRRPSTPSSLAAQISALCSPRSIKTRGLTLAVQDPEVEKMAKMAVILRDICVALEALKTEKDEKQTLVFTALTTSASADGDSGESVKTAAVGGSKKKKAVKQMKGTPPVTAVASILAEFKTLQSNIEQGFYKLPAEFDADVQKIFSAARDVHKKNVDTERLQALEQLNEAYQLQKQSHYEQLQELISDESVLEQFCAKKTTPTAADAAVAAAAANDTDKVTAAGDSNEKKAISIAVAESPSVVVLPTEDIIRCICGLYKDEGLMIQCARCMVWQHTECTKADVDADNYLCERCEPRQVDREIPLEDFTEDGYRYYLSLMRGDLHVRQGDAVYVLRDIPIKDADGNVVPTKKHTYETIGEIDYNECDIFRVERLWKNDDGKRFIFGHHFLRPHETFHEPTRRFYPNEVVRVPLYEVVPIELVIGRCWVLDRTTFCKGRPIECTDDEHCYICELRVDKTARFFSKAKINYPTCTKAYAFRKFPERLKISKTYAPHDVDPAMLKTKKQKTDMEVDSDTNINAANDLGNSAATTSGGGGGSGLSTSNTQQNNSRKRQNNTSPAVGGTIQLITPPPPTVQTIKERRKRLENVLKNLKLKWKNTQPDAVLTKPPIDLSYLLSGRGARQRKSLYNTPVAATATAATSAATSNATA